MAPSTIFHRLSSEGGEGFSENPFLPVIPVSSLATLPLPSRTKRRADVPCRTPAWAGHAMTRHTLTGILPVRTFLLRRLPGPSSDSFEHPALAMSYCRTNERGSQSGTLYLLEISEGGGRSAGAHAKL